LLESFSFLPISDPTARFRRALRNKRFSAACDPTGTEVDERGGVLEPWWTRKRNLDDPEGARRWCAPARSSLLPRGAVVSDDDFQSKEAKQ